MGYAKFSKNVLLVNNVTYQENPKLMELFGVHSKTNNILRIFYEQDFDFRIECVKDSSIDVPTLISPEYGTLNYEEIINRFTY